MFQSFYLCRVSRPIAPSHACQVSAVRGICACRGKVALIIALASDRIDIPDLLFEQLTRIAG